MKLAIGTAQFGLDYGISNPTGKTPSKEIVDILELAHANSIKCLDTAASYGDSEKIINSYLNSHPDQSWKIISKLPSLKKKKDIKSYFNFHFNRSKSLLGSSLNTYMAHDAKQFLSHEVLRDNFFSLRERGIINKIGVSVYSEHEIEKLIEYNIDVIQLPLNILDHRLIKSGILSKIKKCRIEIYARSIFLQGLFFLKENHLKHKFPDILIPLDKLKLIAKKYKLKLRELALLFVYNVPEVDLVITGVNNLAQLKANIISFNKPYNNDITTEILGNIEYDNDNVLNPTLWKR